MKLRLPRWVMAGHAYQLHVSLRGAYQCDCCLGEYSRPLVAMVSESGRPRSACSLCADKGGCGLNWTVAAGAGPSSSGRP